MPKYRGHDITRSNRKGKKYKACKGGKCVHFGAKGYTIRPKTTRGDSYCARSSGIKSSPNSPNSWARALWSCKGKKSVNSKPFFGRIKLP